MKHTIILKYQVGMYTAELIGSSACLAETGSTAAEAIGNLVLQYAEAMGVEIMGVRHESGKNAG